MQLAAKVAQEARRLQLQTSWKDDIPGKDCLKSFRERQNLSLRRPLALAWYVQGCSTDLLSIPMMKI